MTISTHAQLNNVAAEDVKHYATAYFIQAKQAGFTFEQLLKEANAVHPRAPLILKFVFTHF
jgi:hypothetical protein